MNVRVGCLTFFDPATREGSGCLMHPYGIEALEAQGFTLAHVDVDWSQGRPRRDVAAISRFLKATREFDVVFAMFESQANAAALARALHIPGARRVPLVVLSCWLGEEVVHAGRLRLALLGLAYRSVDRLLLLSDNQREILEHQIGLSSSRLLAVPLGVDVDWFGAATTADDRYVVSVGRDRGRDWQTLFDAVDGTGINLRVACRPAEVERLRIPSEVDILGFLPRAQYRDLLSRASIVVVATHERVYPSGQSVALEAMSMGKCVVATDTAALSDYLSHGDTAVLVPPSDPPALRSAILGTLDDPGLREAVGSRARTAVNDHFTTAHMWTAIGDVLTQEVRSHRERLSQR